MSLLLNPNSIYNPFGSGNSGHLRSRLSHLSSNSRRKQRNDLYRARIKGSKIPEEAREFNYKNPDAHGLPRGYKVEFTDPKEDHTLANSIHNVSLTFGHFGRETSGLKLNGHGVDSSHVDFQVATNCCTFQTNLPLHVDGETRSTAIGGYFNFDTPKPTGSIHVNDRIFAVTLAPDPIKFDVKVSANTGAYWSSANNKFSYDIKSDKWKNATWESSMKFAYGPVKIDDPVEPRTIIENYFTDISSNPPTHFDLTVKNWSDFTSVLSDVETELVLKTKTLVPEKPPSSRSNLPVKSVFPTLFVVQFSAFGDSFVGAYKDEQGLVYAVQGKVSEDVDNSLLQALASEKSGPPAEDIFHFLDHSQPDLSVKGGISSSTPLQLQAILGNDSMIVDSKDPSGYSDSVGKLAMGDLYDIIVYYMDEDLRKMFISATPPVLPTEVKSIADDNPKENSKFYKKLQVPYLTLMLANSTVKEGDHCNGARAGKLLQTIPAESEVYKRHSSALYRFRYLERFPDTKMFIQDQRDNDHSAKIDSIATVMKNNIAKNTSNIKQTNPDGYEKNLAKVLGDIDSLAKWAKDKNLYWAFRLLYWVEKVNLPTWYMLYTTGEYKNPTLGMNIKKLNGLFGVLENDQVNTAKGGVSFMEAYNDAIRAFQMIAIIPQLVDVDGNSSEFDSILKSCLNEFYKTYHGNPDKALVELAEHTKELFYKDDIRKKLLGALAKSSRVAQAASAWNLMIKQFDELVINSTWFKALRLGNEILTCFKYVAFGVIIAMPFLPNSWDIMQGEGKILWALSVARLAALFSIKVAQGLVRLNFLWQDISGWGDVIRCALGSEAVVDSIPGAANKISGSFAKYFTRTAKQTLTIAEEEAALAIGEVGEFSRLSKIFGRNMGELIANICGIVLATVCLVLTAISLAKETDLLLIVSDWFMILSASIQILAIVAGWVLAAELFAVEITISILTLVAKFGGPLAVVLAVVGFIVFIVWWRSGAAEKSPVEKFVDSHVKPNGLYMAHRAIDYFDVLAATDTTASRVGISICGASAGSSLPSLAEKVYIHLNAPSSEHGHVDYVKNLDFTTDTVWSLRTDAYGKSQIYTEKMVKDSKGENNRYVWFLSTTDDENEVRFTQWAVDVTQEPQTDSEKRKTLIRALCTVTHETASKQIKHFVLQSHPVKKEPIKFALVDQVQSIPTSIRYIDKWDFELESLRPAPFTYRKNPWKIYTNQRDERNIPILRDTDAISTGYKWSIEPPLDSNLFELITASGPDEGTIQMKRGAKPKVMAEKKYTVSCQLIDNNQPHGTQTADISIIIVNDDI